MRYVDAKTWIHRAATAGVNTRPRAAIRYSPCSSRCERKPADPIFQPLPPSPPCLSFVRRDNLRVKILAKARENALLTRERGENDAGRMLTNKSLAETPADRPQVSVSQYWLIRGEPRIFKFIKLFPVIRSRVGFYLLSVEVFARSSISRKEKRDLKFFLRIFFRPKTRILQVDEV